MASAHTFLERSILFQFSIILRRFYYFEPRCVQFVDNAIALLGLDPLSTEIISMYYFCVNWLTDRDNVRIDTGQTGLSEKIL